MDLKNLCLLIKNNNINKVFELNEILQEDIFMDDPIRQLLD
jgi:hypothetical protein